MNATTRGGRATRRSFLALMGSTAALAAWGGTSGAQAARQPARFVIDSAETPQRASQLRLTGDGLGRLAQMRETLAVLPPGTALDLYLPPADLVFFDIASGQAGRRPGPARGRMPVSLTLT